MVDKGCLLLAIRFLNVPPPWCGVLGIHSVGLRVRDCLVLFSFWS